MAAMWIVMCTVWRSVRRRYGDPLNGCGGKVNHLVGTIQTKASYDPPAIATGAT
jgi:hypothetical protein